MKESNVRPCMVYFKPGKIERALFHGFYAISHPNREILIEGMPGQKSTVNALVETEDGSCFLVYPYQVKFLDTKMFMNQYYWSDTDEWMRGKND